MVKMTLSADATHLHVGVANTAKDPATVVTLPRYLLIELKNDRGQFTRGVPVGASPALPSPTDYRTLAATQVDDSVFQLEITRGDDTLRIGDVLFTNPPAVTEVRVTYKADAVMPNLRSKDRKIFERGPVSAKLVFPVA